MAEKRFIYADILIQAFQEEFNKEGAKADDMAMRGIADASVKYSHGQFCYLNAIERVKDATAADVVEVVRCNHITPLYDPKRYLCRKDDIYRTERYTEKQIMTALEIRMPHDMICRESYDLIKRKNAQIEHLTAEKTRLQNLLKEVIT